MQIGIASAVCGAGRGRGEIFVERRWTHEDLHDLGQRGRIRAYLQVLLKGALAVKTIRVVRGK